MPAWTGLGMGNVFETNLIRLGNQCDYLLTHGIRDIRVSLPDYVIIDTSLFYEPIKLAVSKGMRVVWGVSSNPTQITATNWPAFRAAVLAAATWSQANGVDQFEIGNEEENHVDNTTLSVADLRTNLKALATDVQSIFTRGNVSYSPGSIVSALEGVTGWGSIGKGDIDLLGLNIYRDSYDVGDNNHFKNNWKSDIDAFYALWGISCEVTEWNVSCRTTNSWSTNQEKQSQGIAEMMEYIKASGIPRAYFFCWESTGYGVFDGNQSYILPWNNLSTNNGRRWFDNL